MSKDHDLAQWIRDLRARLKHGHLADLPPFDIGDGTGCFPGEKTIHIMLADLDGYDDMTDGEAHDAINVARRDGLLGDFRLLRILIG